ncbi:unnamed protein product [Cyprideis torosa]|uniref:RNA helicase n=1 Tax=Cyprideis torosa TaxID=163714 RepID=A0A7R8WKE1_9CRUS|nr:unnamed protein product [Cyprideis torosa]CAG0896985.1 unnamed protein product [Cyprideis torosa]
MADLIRTIDESGELPAEIISESEDEDDDTMSGCVPEKNPGIIASRKKASTLGAKKRGGLSKSFSFKAGLSSISEPSYDPWAEVAEYVREMKKNNPTASSATGGSKSKTVDERIRELRQKKKATASIDKPEEEEQSDGSTDHRDDVFRLRERNRKAPPPARGRSTEDQRLTNTAEDIDLTAFDTDVSFEMLNLSRPLLKACLDLNFAAPTQIQAVCIPLALQGRDICGCAATGTGKTAAYMLPILERLLYKPSVTAVTRVLVLVPTRELGVQVFQVTNQLCRHAKNIEVSLAVGGLDVEIQEARLRRIPDIVIATPGRLIDHLINTPTFGLENIEVLVLDEADRMLDEYFSEQIREIIQQCAATRQTILFSATMTDKVKDLAAVSLKNPVRLFVNSNRDVAANLQQQFIKIKPAQEPKRVAILASLLDQYRDHVLVFVPTKKEAHRLHILLGLLGFECGELHGNLSQTERLEMLRRFKEDQFSIMLATDVMARGLDIQGIRTVINLTLPASYEQYVHRVGRTARAGQRGLSISLVGERERPVLKEIMKNAKDPLIQRNIDSAVIEKYVSALQDEEENVAAILQEEEAAKELEKAEAQLRRTEEKGAGALSGVNDRKIKKARRKIGRGEPVTDPAILKLMGENGQRKREWFQTPKELEQEREALKKRGRKYVQEDPIGGGFGPSKKKRRMRGKVDEDDKLRRTADFQVRAMKRARKEQRLRAVPEEGKKKFKSLKPPMRKKKKRGMVDDLVNTGQRSIKKLRQEANQVQRKKQKFGGRGGKISGGKGGKRRM